MRPPTRAEMAGVWEWHVCAGVVRVFHHGAAWARWRLVRGHAVRAAPGLSWTPYKELCPALRTRALRLLKALCAACSCLGTEGASGVRALKCRPEPIDETLRWSRSMRQWARRGRSSTTLTTGPRPGDPGGDQ